VRSSVKYRPKPRDEVKRNMSAIRSTNGLTERSVRSLLHRSGFRFWKNHEGTLGRPDIVFPGARLAVFIDGDYWHARFLKEHGANALRERLRGRPNPTYWFSKLQRNANRDSDISKRLRAEGWTVLRIWESAARKEPERAVRRITQALDRAGRSKNQIAKSKARSLTSRRRRPPIRS
jgi:DNA mismatch endonuclease, patch repair protein